jgi:hypothetical protein
MDPITPNQDKFLTQFHIKMHNGMPHTKQILAYEKCV